MEGAGRGRFIFGGMRMNCREFSCTYEGNRRERRGGGSEEGDFFQKGKRKAIIHDEAICKRRILSRGEGGIETLMRGKGGSVKCRMGRALLCD